MPQPKRTFFLLLIVFGTLFNAACGPSTPPEHYGPPGDPPDLSAVAQGPLEDPEAFKEHLEKLHVVRSWKMAEVVELEGKELEQVDQALKRTDDKIFDAHLSMRKNTRALKQALRADAPSKEIEALTAKIITSRRTLHDLKFTQFDEASQGLSPEKKAKLLLFLPEFERKVRRSMKRGAHKDREHRRKRRRGGKRRGKRGHRPPPPN